MGGRCIEKISCKECGSSDGLQVFEQDDGSYDGWCYACSSYVKDPYVEGGVVMKERGEEYSYGKDEKPDELPVVGLYDRGLREDVCRVYNVRSELSKADGRTITKSYYEDTKEGKPCGYEVRNHKDKSFYGIGDRKGKLDLWGAGVAKKNNGKKLFITEGRLDALSLYQAIVDNTPAKYSHLKPSVVSLTRGAAGASKDILNNRDFVESFSEVVLVFDNDDAGQQALGDVLKIFPSFKVADLPLKDANDMIMEGRDKELFNQVMWKAEVKRQGSIIRVDDEFIERALVRPKFGIETPWPSVTKLIYGFRPHTIHIVGAAPKIGKSDHEYQVIHHLIYKLGIKVGVFDLENVDTKTAKKAASKEGGVDFTSPATEYDDSLLSSLLSKQKEYLFLYDRKSSRDWPDIRMNIEEMHLLDGVNMFVIDPITALISRFDSSKANDLLNEIMTDAADLVYKYPITLMFYSHVNPKPKSAKAHEDGGRVLSSEFTGSRAMEKWAHYGWGIRRNRGPDCPPEEQNVSYLDLLFDRDFGNSGTVPLYFNKEDCSYLEMAL